MNIIRLSTTTAGHEPEINRPVEINGEVFYLYQRPTTRPANPILVYHEEALNESAVFYFNNELGDQPQTYWLAHKHNNEIFNPDIEKV